MALLGRIDSFDLKTDNITKYIERVEQYFIENDVTDEKKQTAIFLTVIGNETYSLLRTLLAPESPAGLMKNKHFLMSYRSMLHTTTSFMHAQVFICRNISTKIDLIKPSRLIVKKKSHDENEIRSFSLKDNVIVRFFGGKEHRKSIGNFE